MYGYELLPGQGLILPRGAGRLLFGMSEREARWTVSTLADVRETWVCGAAWSFWAAHEGVELLVCGAPDRERRLDWLKLDRLGSGAAPVGWADVDLFGHEQDEVERALAGVDRAGVALTRSSGAYLRAVTLTAAPGQGR
ncbi:hypothetical protein STRCI_005697 [Streptomyces cinnabarinus]|uniref:Uncharacterized protein n=1 Tax=Streptomyces cinnabarinus TaxID=67287 RepID=A0ABY7KJS7_9ACTN|nr:hypothetical protein [Streptomyces cinnabarinus]WAZ24293.1 hypothetical protein STRCI_005697 [Streptomyces cinnabarinus]